MIQLALYQPDIPQNVGAAMRLCACLGVPLHIIEPCGFPWDERKIKTAAMDYYDAASLTRHKSWDTFKGGTMIHCAPTASRIVLLTTKSDHSYTDFTFQDGDILMLGRESAGVPDDVHNAADARVTIAMAPGMRSLNVINAGAMVLGEALRQTS